jgi:ribonuclease HI
MVNKLRVKMMNDNYKVYTDGSCLGNGKKNATGGIGVYYHDLDIENISLPFENKPITNQRAELTACIKGITELVNYDKYDKNRGINIYTDSQYTINCIMKWYNGWTKNDWQTTKKKPVKNRELIEELHDLYMKHNVYFIHVKAHQDEPDKEQENKWRNWYGNKMADSLATF